MVKFLKSIEIFRGLQEPHLDLVARAVEQLELTAGAVLFRQGEHAEAFYIVRSGTLEVVVTLSSGEQQALATLRTGELVGEMAVLYGQPRSATVRALTSVTLLKIGRSTLEQLFSVSPAARGHFYETASRRLARLSLASVPIFAGLNEELLRELNLDSNWVRLAGGETLFRQGDPADHVYVVVRGRLEVVVDSDAGRGELVDQLGQGALVGEVALLSGAPRSATVRAIRDSELLQLSKAELFRLLERHPRGALEVIRILAQRVRPVPPAGRRAPVSTIALVPAGRWPVPPEWCRRLVAALSAVGGPTLHVTEARLGEELGDGSVEVRDDELHRLRVGTWLREQEDRFRFVVSECGPSFSPWTELCLRQADLVLLVAPADADPSARELDPRVLGGEVPARSTQHELVLVHGQDAGRPVGTARWLSAFRVLRHHHVRIDRAEDYARLARFITGKAVGLAVSGGGARAFAHVGVIRALEESGIPIDAVGGVSAGAFPVALHAMGSDPERLVAFSKQYIGDGGLVADATLPMVAFLSGRGMVRALRRIFADTEIEDLWRPFFCLSTNLSTARIVVHESGPLWLAMRATTSVPGIAPPVCINGELLVDGGVLNNLPADVMRSRGLGTVIASDVGVEVDLTTDEPRTATVSGWPLLWARLNPFGKPRSFPHIFEILMRTAAVGSIHHGSSVAEYADLYVHTPARDVPTFDLDRGSVLIERGYQRALEEIGKWTAGGGNRRWETP